MDEVKRIRRETRSPRPLDQEAESGLASQDLHPKPLQQERDSGKRTLWEFSSLICVTFAV